MKKIILYYFSILFGILSVLIGYFSFNMGGYFVSLILFILSIENAYATYNNKESWLSKIGPLP